LTSRNPGAKHGSPPRGPGNGRAVNPGRRPLENWRTETRRAAGGTPEANRPARGWRGPIGIPGDRRHSFGAPYPGLGRKRGKKNKMRGEAERLPVPEGTGFLGRGESGSFRLWTR